MNPEVLLMGWALGLDPYGFPLMWENPEEIQIHWNKHYTEIDQGNSRPQGVSVFKYQEEEENQSSLPLHGIALLD